MHVSLIRAFNESLDLLRCKMAYIERHSHNAMSRVQFFHGSPLMRQSAAILLIW